MLKSLKTQIVLTSSLCLAAGVLAITLTNYFTARQHAYQGLAEQNLALARSHAKAIAEWVQSKQSLVQAAVNDAEPSKSLLMLRDAGQFVGTYFDYVNAYAPAAPGAGQVPARPGQEQALRTGRPVVTSPAMPPGGGTPVITFAAPVGPEGAVTSVGAADAAMDAVLANVASIRPTESSEAFLVDAEGTVLAHPQAGRLLKPAAEISADLAPDALRQAAARSAWVPVRVGGQKYLLMVVPVEGMPWMLAVLLHEAQALAPITAVLAVSIAASALVLLVTAVLLGGFIAHRLARLGQLRDAMREVASGAGAADSGGDLARRMDTRGDDELADIAASFNAFADRQAVVLARIHEASTCVRLAAREIAAGNLDLSHRTEETVAGLTGMSASMQQLTDAVQGNAASTHQANQLASQASQVAQRGGEVVGRAVQTMDEISAASRKIADIIGVIDSIAFQTNILALNAAVEAARAGEQGRGFAVVAAEVRQLAQRSAQAAHEIRALISSSVERVQDGARLVHGTGRTIEEIVGAVREVVSVIGHIHASTVAQSDGIAAMGQSVLRLEGLAQQNAALVEQSAASAAALEDQSAALAGVMGRSPVRA